MEQAILQEKEMETNTIKGTTYATYKYPLKKIEESALSNIKIQKVSSRDVQLFLNSSKVISNGEVWFKP